MRKGETGRLTTLAALVERLEGYGELPAVIQFTRDDRDVLSYGKLGREAERLAAGLKETGVTTGENVAVMAEPSPEWFVAALAILRLGAVLVPIDAQMGDKDLERVLEDSGVRSIFTTSRIARRLREFAGEETKRQIFLLDDADEELQETAKPWRSLSRDEPASFDTPDADETTILFYTSGTTGPPKGVPLSHRNILFQIQAIEKTGLVKGDDRLLLPLPLHHVYPLVIGLFVPLGLGVGIVLPQALTGDAIVRALTEGKVTVILGVPRLYRALYEGIRGKVGAAGRLGTGLFEGAMAVARNSRRIGLPLGNLLFRPIRNKMGPRVRMLASGGSPLDPELAENLEALGWPIAVGYGLTETSPLLTLKRPGEGTYASVGRAIEGVKLKIDPSALPESEREAQEAGETEHKRGEVLAKGPSVFEGYHNLPEKTEEAFQEGWFRTGDLGYLDEKKFLCLGGRASSMIVLEGGENINPENLEDYFAEVEEVAEIGVLEDGGKLAALVVPDRTVLREHRDSQGARKIIEGALRRRAEGLPSYKKFSCLEISRSPLPATRLGKIKRHELRERYEAAKRGEEEGKRETGAVPIDQLSSEDRTLLENPRARKLWDLLAKRYADRRISPDANLDLDLGIDSLEWVELSLSAHERAGIAITEELIERAETVRDLLEEAASAEAAELAEGKRPIEAPEDVLSDSDKRWADRRGPLALLAATIIYGLGRILMRLRCPVEARGVENLPRSGPYILVPNHVSFLDSPAVGLAVGYETGRKLFWAGQGEILFRNLFRRMFSRIFQVVPIDARRGPLSSLAFSALVVKRGHPLVWFPEGHVSKDGTLQAFRPGIGLIVDHYEPAVVPVFIEGTFEVMPLGQKLPAAGKLRVTFGKPIEGACLKEQANELHEGEIHERIANVLRQAVRELSESTPRSGPNTQESDRRAA